MEIKIFKISSVCRVEGFITMFHHSKIQENIEKFHWNICLVFLLRPKHYQLIFLRQKLGCLFEKQLNINHVKLTKNPRQNLLVKGDYCISVTVDRNIFSTIFTSLHCVHSFSTVYDFRACIQYDSVMDFNIIVTYLTFY